MRTPAEVMPAADRFRVNRPIMPQKIPAKRIAISYFFKTKNTPFRVQQFIDSVDKCQPRTVCFLLGRAYCVKLWACLSTMSFTFMRRTLVEDSFSASFMVM